MTKQDPWAICPACDGDGTTVNPSIDAHGLTADDFYDDPDFADDYATGAFDIHCNACHGTGKLRQSRIEELHEAADDRRMQAAENGDFEAYSCAHDLRFGF